MTPILLVLWIICSGVLFICTVMIWKILDDCKKRRLRRERHQELLNGRTSISGSNSSG